MATSRDPANSTAHIVVLDDDVELRNLIADYLNQHGLRITTAANGIELRQLLKRDPADVVVLDVMMPGEDGLSVLRSLAGQRDRPAIIMMSALGADTDRIVGLEMGADDYLAKPINPRELLARIRAVLRRAAECFDEEVVERGGWTFYLSSFTAFSPDGTSLDLTSGEFRLAVALATNAGRIMSRDALHHALHEHDNEAYDRAIDVMISRLRAKFSAQGGDELIRTVRGEGYLFVPSR